MGLVDPGEKVSVAFHGISREATGDSLGNWGHFLLPSLPGGRVPAHRDRPATRSFWDDVLIGDVWFASGQSNMEFPLIGFAAHR